MRPSRRPRRLTGLSRWLVAVPVLALLLRVAVLGGTPGFVPAYDAADYHRVATAIAQTGGYPPTTYAAPGTPSAFRPPAWPYAVAATQVLAGPGWNAARLLGALLGALGVLLAMLVAHELLGARVAVVAGGLMAVFPPLLFADVALLSEPMFTACSLGMAWALLRARRSDHGGRWLAAAGALAGLAILTRTQGAVLLVPLVVAGWRVSRPGVAAAVGVAAVVLVPWTVRNAQAFGTLVPVTTQGGYTLAGTYNPVAAGEGPFKAAARIPAEVPELQAVLAEPGQDEADIDRRLGAAARAFLARRPGYVAEVAGRNTLRMWTLGGPQQGWLTRLSHSEMGVPARLDGVLSLATVLSLLAAVAGGAVLVRRRHGPAWPWAVPALLWLSGVLVSGAPRYRLVVDPFVLLLGAVAVDWWRSRRATRPRLEVAA